MTTNFVVSLMTFKETLYLFQSILKFIKTYYF